MIGILQELFDDHIASCIFIYVSHPLVDVVKEDSIYREVMKYPTGVNSFSAWYFNEFENVQWNRKWEWKRRWRNGKQVVVRRRINYGRMYIYR